MAFKHDKKVVERQILNFNYTKPYKMLEYETAIEWEAVSSEKEDFTQLYKCYAHKSPSIRIIVTIVGVLAWSLLSCSCDLDPRTFIYEFDQDRDSWDRPIRIHKICKLSRPRVSEVRALPCSGN